MLESRASLDASSITIGRVLNGQKTCVPGTQVDAIDD